MLNVDVETVGLSHSKLLTPNYHVDQFFSRVPIATTSFKFIK